MMRRWEATGSWRSSATPCSTMAVRTSTELSRNLEANEWRSEACTRLTLLLLGLGLGLRLGSGWGWVLGLGVRVGVRGWGACCAT